MKWGKARGPDSSTRLHVARCATYKPHAVHVLAKLLYCDPSSRLFDCTYDQTTLTGRSPLSAPASVASIA